jgi:hypothetical protein
MRDKKLRVPSMAIVVVFLSLDGVFCEVSLVLDESGVGVEVESKVLDWSGNVKVV